MILSNDTRATSNTNLQLPSITKKEKTETRPPCTLSMQYTPSIIIRMALFISLSSVYYWYIHTYYICYCQVINVNKCYVKVASRGYIYYRSFIRHEKDDRYLTTVRVKSFYQTSQMYRIFVCTPRDSLDLCHSPPVRYIYSQTPHHSRTQRKRERKTRRGTPTRRSISVDEVVNVRLRRKICLSGAHWFV